VRDTATVTALALLVQRVDRPAMDLAVADLRAELGPRIRPRYVGPQPAYAFLDSVETEATAWA